MKKFLHDYWIPALIVLIGVGIVVVRMVFAPVIIQSGSMEPTLPVRAIAFTLPTDTLKPGDIITFQQADDDRAVTHRFIGYADDGSLNTKGDANATPDVREVPLQKSDVIGKVVFAALILAPTYWGSVKGVVSLGIIAWMAISIAIVLILRKRELQKEKQIAQEKTLAPNLA